MHASTTAPALAMRTMGTKANQFDPLPPEDIELLRRWCQVVRPNAPVSLYTVRRLLATIELLEAQNAGELVL